VTEKNRVKCLTLSRFAVLACVLAITWAPTALAQDKPAEGQMPQMPQMSEEQMAEMMAWMEANKTGEHHEHLAKFAGKWKAKVKYWPDPAQEPQVSTGTMTSSMVLGGRYLHSMYQGEMMGMPFEGAGIDAFDNVSGKYISMWMDNMSTGVMTWKGKCNGDGTVRTMYGEMTAPDGAKIKSRTVATMVDENSQKYESFMVLPDGAEKKEMEITLTRM
jgi:hypothetical protein